MNNIKMLEFVTKLKKTMKSIFKNNSLTPEVLELDLDQKRKMLVANIYSFYATFLPQRKGTTQFINPRSGSFISENTYMLEIKYKPDKEDIRFDIVDSDEATKHLNHDTALFYFKPNKCELISMTYNNQPVHIPKILKV